MSAPRARAHRVRRPPWPERHGRATWTWTLDLTGLADGKHTLHLEGSADDGVMAEDLLLPFWRGPGADFVWDDALIYMLMTDRFVNGNASNDPAPLPNAAQGPTGWAVTSLA